MAMTDSYRKQHDELLDLALKLSTRLTIEDILKNANDFVELLSQFTSKLNIHFAMEDKALYVKLLASSDSTTAQTAKEYMNEMGGIKKEVENYIHSWSLPKSLTANPQKFIHESNAIIKRIRHRIDKENNVLYPLADKMQN